MLVCASVCTCECDQLFRLKYLSIGILMLRKLKNYKGNEKVIVHISYI